MYCKFGSLIKTFYSGLDLIYFYLIIVHILYVITVDN